MKSLRTYPAIIISVFLLASCSKPLDEILNGKPKADTNDYYIPAGQHYSTGSSYSATSYSELRFTVKFDSSAIYTTKDAGNQYDVNKLYGFSDNGSSHQQFSARIGWRWSDNALRLFGYIYNNGQFSFEEITKISIGQENDCAIIVSGSSYIFNVNGNTVSMPRLSAGSVATGYKLYPYFGGDEPAPHNIHIWIKEK